MQLELERYLELEKAAATVTPGAQSNWAISLDGNTMSWQGQLDGDYNQDGEVGLADLVPLSRHLGERAPFEQGSIQQMLDGDGNGEVNIADVQVIARNYGRRITHYAVLGSNEARDHPADSGTVGPGAQLLGQLATAEGSGEGRLQYSWLLDRQAGWTYWVTALDSGTAVDSSRPVGIDNWCMFGGNARHTGRSPFSVAGPVVVSQLARDGQDEEIQLISTPGGVLYRATGWATVSAFSLQDDTELWRVEAPSEVRSLTATADGGLLVAAGFYIHRYTADGDLLWTFDAGNWISCPPVPRSDGAIICGRTMITDNVTIGRFFHCNIYSYVAHDCVIGDFVTFGPRVSCNGNVRIDDHAYVGAGAVIRQGAPGRPLVIGKGAVVGMGAVVVRDVAPCTTVVGNPARPLDPAILDGPEVLSATG